MTTPFQRLFVVIPGLAAVAATAVPVARASDLSVCAHGCEFTTVQRAVDSAHDGDVILIGAGTYFENVNVNKALTLSGAGRDKTRLDGSSLGTVLSLSGDSLGDTPIVITNMTITHGRGVGVGGGVDVEGGVRLDMSYCILVSNSSVAKKASVGVGGFGGGIEVGSFPSSPNKIAHTVFTYNHADSGGGAIDVSYESSVEITNSAISRNDSASDGGGILVLNKAGANIKNTTITDNISATAGGGVSVAFGQRRLNPSGVVSIDSSIIASNSTSGDGGGISGPIISMSNTVIAHNHANVDGGGWSAGGEATLADVFVIQNTAGHRGGGILGSELLGLTNTTISQNQPDNCANLGSTLGCP
jgi:predicted outer membrane repeat protein